MIDDIMDAEFESTGTALATRTNLPATWTPTFAVAVDEMVERVNAKRDFMRRVMREGEHYGPIPGAGDKKVLFKPGAEVLLASMGLALELSDAELPIRDYGDDAHEGMVVYRRVARIYKQTGYAENERIKVAQAEGSCSSREAKYRWRNQERACPDCGKNAIKTSKFEDSPGYFCFKKIGGCGAKFKLGDPAIESQVTGRIPNPDLADAENTILKMADKRAMVAATLIATGCSDLFTQDLDDVDPLPDDPTPPRTQNAGSAAPQATKAASVDSGASAPAQTPDFDSPGSIRPGTLAALYRGKAKLDYDGDERAMNGILGRFCANATKGRVFTANFEALSEHEAVEVGKLMKAAIDAKETAAEVPLPIG
jgi:hypothetical protein